MPIHLHVSSPKIFVWLYMKFIVEVCTKSHLKPVIFVHIGSLCINPTLHEVQIKFLRNGSSYKNL